MKLQTLIFILFSILLTTAGHAETSDITDEKLQAEPDLSALLVLHNQARAESRRCGSTKFATAPALTWSEKLARAAKVHSKLMAKHDELEHGQGANSIESRLANIDYQPIAYAENIASGTRSKESVMTLWLNSASHCATIMGDKYTEMGAAEVDGYWTAVFGKPLEQLTLPTEDVSY